MRIKQQGFTLLEVMLALTIFAVIATTIMNASSQGINSIIRLEEKTLASWLAENKLTELRLSKQFSIGEKKEQVKMAKQDWQITTKTEKTKLPNIYRISILVGRKNQEDSLINLVGVVSNQ